MSLISGALLINLGFRIVSVECVGCFAACWFSEFRRGGKAEVYVCERKIRLWGKVLNAVVKVLQWVKGPETKSVML
jgi:hypothetical protein